MNKTALGFGIGLVLISAAAVAYLALFGGAPQTTPPTPATPPAATANATPAAGEEVEPQPNATAKATPETATPDPNAVPPELAGLKEPPKIPQPEVVSATRLSFTRTVPDAADFASKDTLDVNVRVEHVEGNDPVRAMGMQEQIPEGYALDSFSGARQPEVKPPAGTRGVLEFAWIQFPQEFFPAEFTYRLKKIGTPGASPKISGQVLFRTSGEELRTEVVNSLLGNGAEPAAASGPSATPEEKGAKPEAAAMPARPAAAADPNAPAPAPAVDPNAPSLHLAQVSKADGYTAGQPVELELKVEKQGEGKLGAVAVVVNIPSGWTFDALTGGAVPPVKPQQGAQGTLTFIFIELPEFPVIFGYTLKPAENASGEAQVKAKVLYRANNTPAESVEIATVIPQK